jgi:hypothetical protein
LAAAAARASPGADVNSLSVARSRSSRTSVDGSPDR